MEKRTYAEIRAAGSDTNPLLLGFIPYETRSADLGGFVETLKIGAFRRTVQSQTDVLARLEHQGGLLLLGRRSNGTLTLNENSSGLSYEVRLPDTTAARDLVALVKRGDLTKSSFAFTVHGSDGQRWSTLPTGETLRELYDVNLYDVAPVSAPAYDDTSIAVRYLQVWRTDFQKHPHSIPDTAPFEDLIESARKRVIKADTRGADGLIPRYYTHAFKRLPLRLQFERMALEFLELTGLQSPSQAQRRHALELLQKFHEIETGVHT